jgi:hypothetical protein
LKEFGSSEDIQPAKLPGAQRGRFGGLNVLARVVGYYRSVDVARGIRCGRRGALGVRWRNAADAGVGRQVRQLGLAAEFTSGVRRLA